MPQPTKHLTPIALDVLRSVQAGDVYRSESLRTLYRSFRMSDRKNVTRWIDPMCTMGLIRIGQQRGAARPWLITEDGEAELAKHQPQR